MLKIDGDKLGGKCSSTFGSRSPGMGFQREQREERMKGKVGECPSWSIAVTVSSSSFRLARTLNARKENRDVFGFQKTEHVPNGINLNPFRLFFQGIS